MIKQCSGGSRGSRGGHIAEGAPFWSEGAPFLAQSGTKFYRGAPIFASWGGGWELKILGLQT